MQKYASLNRRKKIHRFRCAVTNADLSHDSGGNNGGAKVMKSSFSDSGKTRGGSYNLIKKSMSPHAYFSAILAKRICAQSSMKTICPQIGSQNKEEE